MRKKHHSETEIVRILREAETRALLRQEYAHSKNISEQTFCKWSEKNGQVTTSRAASAKSD